MFNLGTSEIVIILIVALLVLGPAKLPEIGKQIGQMLREFRNMTGDVQNALNLDDNNYRSYDTSYNRSSSYTYHQDEPHAIEEHHEDEPKAVEAFSYSAPAHGAPVAAIDTRHDEEMAHSPEIEHDEHDTVAHASEAPMSTHTHTESETTNTVQTVKSSA